MPNAALIAGPLVDLSSAAAVLAEATGLQIISPGNVCREHVQLRTPLGEQMNRYMQTGHLVPDELTTKAIADALAVVDGGWLLCNYPRRIGQAELLAQSAHAPDTVIELVLTKDELDLTVRRRVERQLELAPQQAERRAELLLMYSHYQEEYQEQVEPLRAYYRTRGMLWTTSGSGDYEDIAAKLLPVAADYPCREALRRLGESLDQ
ncbi:nucleoside monophosphate kinase [Micromonospora sp. NPDC005413]|uniref:nucleoside monophosphate kinase n=1 Tax=Micromonospora sp. NPDC005413 TaxID=3154563 RepID=UPI00339F6389